MMKEAVASPSFTPGIARSEEETSRRRLGSTSTMRPISWGLATPSSFLLSHGFTFSFAALALAALAALPGPGTRSPLR